jgi:hypothetical protein
MTIAALPAVDVPTAKELIEQVHQHLEITELHGLAAEVAGKHRRLRELMTEPGLGADRLREALGWTFVGRRRASAILGVRSDAELEAWVAGLLADDLPPGARLERFSADAGPLSGSPAAVELGAELLHFTRPAEHALWSRWVWSTESRTGALPLLIGEEYDLEAGSVAEGYERVCQATRALDQSPEAGAFRGPDGGPFGTDVLLACTYGVYMRTVLGLKMTQEFNALVPQMAQLVRRLLGTHQHRQEASA